MRPLAALLVAVAAALAGGSPAAAADPVNAAVTLDRTSIAVGDQVALNVIVDAETGYAVSDPTIARQIATFEVVHTQTTQKSTRGAVVRYTFRYLITAWTVGEHVLPPIEIPWAGPDGVSGIARTGEERVTVVSVIGAGEDPSDIKPLKPQLTLAESLLSRLGRIAAGAGAVVAATAIAALAFWLFLRRRAAPTAEERLSPVQRALRELNELADLRLPEQGRTPEHYERLTASLRRYAVARYGVQPGRTSREVRDALERAGLERTQAGAIYELLREGDEVRFRHSVPYPAHAQNAVRSALEIVRRAATAEEYEIAALQPQS